MKLPGNFLIDPLCQTSRSYSRLFFQIFQNFFHQLCQRIIHRTRLFFQRWISWTIFYWLFKGFAQKFLQRFLEELFQYPLRIGQEIVFEIYPEARLGFLVKNPHGILKRILHGIIPRISSATLQKNDWEILAEEIPQKVFSQFHK